MTDGETRPDLDFERWYRQEHHRVLTALAVAGGDVEIAREATDEAFVRAYERWSRVRVMDSPGGWLYRVALNELRRRARRQTLERELLRRNHHQRLDTAQPPIADPNLWDAVRGLPRRQRSAVALRYVLDLTERDVAATMGISRGAASATLTAARKRLQEVIGEPVTDPIEPTRSTGAPPVPPASSSTAAAATTAPEQAGLPTILGASTADMGAADG